MFEGKEEAYKRPVSVQCVKISVADTRELDVDEDFI
jgi:hypothetical protein